MKLAMFHRDGWILFGHELTIIQKVNELQPAGLNSLRVINCSLKAGCSMKLIRSESCNQLEGVKIASDEFSTFLSIDEKQENKIIKTLKTALSNLRYQN